MMIFQGDQKVKVLFGQGVVGQLGELAASVGRKKALVVCDPGMLATGNVDKVVAGLKNGSVESVVFSENEPNPPIKAVLAGYEVYKKEGCDFIVAIGGGSNMDCAKGIQILKHNPEPLMQYANGAKPFDVGSDLVLIPTTSGTGSELSDGSILSDDNHVKFNFIADQAFAEYAVVDVELMAGMPPRLTAATGLDTLCHAVEGYTGTLRNDFVSFYAEKVIDTVAEYLPRAVADGSDMEARAKMAVAASIGGFLLIKAHTNAGHSIGQTVGGRFNIPHGQACAYAEPWVLEYNAGETPKETAYIAKALGAKLSGNETAEELGVKVREAFIDFRDNKCGLQSIKEYEYDEAQFDELAQMCAEEFFQQFNAKPMDKEACLEILKNMYE